MIDGKNLFDQPIKNDLKTYYNIRKIATDQGNNSTTGCLLDYPHFKKFYKLIAMNLTKQQKLDADSKEIHQINFTGKKDREEGATKFFIIKEVKNSFRFFKRNTWSIMILFCFNKLLNKMTQYNTLNVKLTNSQLNKWKHAIKMELK